MPISNIFWPLYSSGNFLRDLYFSSFHQGYKNLKLFCKIARLQFTNHCDFISNCLFHYQMHILQDENRRVYFSRCTKKLAKAQLRIWQSLSLEKTRYLKKAAFFSDSLLSGRDFTLRLTCSFVHPAHQSLRSWMPWTNFHSFFLSLSVTEFLII